MLIGSPWFARIALRKEAYHLGKAGSNLMAVDASPDNEAALLDDMIEQRLAAKGKRLVDADQVARLKKAISDLNDVLRDVGA